MKNRFAPKNRTPRRILPIACATTLAINFAIALSQPVHADQIPNELLLVNIKTAKCLTIAGGVSTDNNVDAVQFECDRDPSRRWTLTERGGGSSIYQIKNVRTGKCLTIARGREY